MNKKDLSIPFNAPLNPQDTEQQTYGCRANNPNQIYAGITDYQMSVLFPLWIVFVKNRQELGKSNITSSRIKPLNYCL